MFLAEGISPKGFFRLALGFRRPAAYGLRAIAVALSNEASRRLAQYRPFDRGGLNLQEVLQDLVLAAAGLNDGDFASLAACRDAFQALWGLDVEIDELRTVSEEMGRTNLAEAGHAGITLTTATRQLMERRSTDSAATEEQALTDWENEVRDLRPDLSDGDLRCLRDDLDTWLQQVITRHGAEAALMLYPEEPRAHRLFDEIDAFATGSLPRRTGACGSQR